MASESARERAERWLVSRRLKTYTERARIDDLAALLDEHARAELEALVEDWPWKDLHGAIEWLRARAARIGGGA